MNARYYDPKTREFISRDQVEGNLADPLSLNKFSYFQNNPERYIDPNGNFVFLAPLAWYAGSVALDVITDMLMNPQADLKYCLLGSMFSNAIPGGGIVNKAKKVQKVCKHSFQALRRVKVSENARKIAVKTSALRNIDTSVWNKGSFDFVGSSIIKHFEKHDKKVGAEDVAQYVRKSVAFSKNLRGASKSRVNGSTVGVIRYKKNGKYIDLASDGSIISFGNK